MHSPANIELRKPENLAIAIETDHSAGDLARIEAELTYNYRSVFGTLPPLVRMLSEKALGIIGDDGKRHCKNLKGPLDISIDRYAPLILIGQLNGD